MYRAAGKITTSSLFFPQRFIHQSLSVSADPFVCWDLCVSNSQSEKGKHPGEMAVPRENHGTDQESSGRCINLA